LDGDEISIPIKCHGMPWCTEYIVKAVTNLLNNELACPKVVCGDQLAAGEITLCYTTHGSAGEHDLTEVWRLPSCCPVPAPDVEHERRLMKEYHPCDE
jgi:hypothetical protein